MVSEADRKVEAARGRWNEACRAWSRDDASDMTVTIQRGEQVMFAATDLICALEDAVIEREGR